MDANELEKSYQEITRGDSEPDVMYLLGRTIKEWDALEGVTRSETTDGFPIQDNWFYMVTRQGIWLVE